MKDLDRQTLMLKAKIEFGPRYEYTIRNGGLGPTLFIDAVTRTEATKVRKLAPTEWEGLYVMVIYNSTAEEEKPKKVEDKIVKKPETAES